MLKKIMITLDVVIWIVVFGILVYVTPIAFGQWTATQRSDWLAASILSIFSWGAAIGVLASKWRRRRATATS